MKKEHDILVKTFRGLEGVLKSEIEGLGFTKLFEATRGVIVTADPDAIYKLNYLCRTALKVLVNIAKFKAANQVELYEEVKKIDWSEYLDVDQTFAIDSNIFNSNFNNSMFVSQKTKDAIVDQFREKFDKRPSVNTEQPDVRINVHINKDDCTLSLDSSGDSLHMRGYRTTQVAAPLSEVLAAGLIMLTEWDKKTDIIDPMCGSGTFLTEAAMIGTNTPAGYFRERFGFEKWKGFKPEIFNSVKNKADSEMTTLQCTLKGYDKDPRATNSARENIANAGFSNDIEIGKVTFETLKPDADSDHAMLIINPPYGERLQEEEEVKELYTMIGDQLKNRWQGHTAWILSSNIEALKNIGLKTSRRLIVYNGPLECKFQKYEMYEGTRKHKNLNSEE